MTETTANGIVKWTNGDPSSIVQESQAQGDSIELALSKRERYDFVWANSAERTAQTGMVQGSRGYQVDTKTEYIYDNSNWRLASSYITMTGSTGVTGTGTANGGGTFTVNPSLSTDTSFVAPGASLVTIVNPGVYSIQFLGKENAASMCTGQSQLVISSGNSFSPIADRLSNGMFSGSLMATCVLPFHRITSSNTNLWFFFYNDSGANRTLNTTVSIGRVS